MGKIPKKYRFFLNESPPYTWRAEKGQTGRDENAAVRLEYNIGTILLSTNNLIRKKTFTGQWESL